MNTPVRITLLCTAIAALAFLGLPLVRDSKPTPEPKPGDSASETAPIWTSEEIFRRAFWRHPTKTDRIRNAQRREWATASEPDIQRWQWFIELNPSPELLHSLRDPETFGLLPADIPRPWLSDASPVPDWFPTATSPGFKVLQTPAGGLTVLYRPLDNVLFATDSGNGFSPPIK
jgi:hypothetical protein